MLYDNYQKRMKRLSSILQWIKRFRALIIFAVVLIAVVSGTLMGVKGIVYDETTPPLTLAYGESLNYSAGAIMGEIRYEYKSEGGEWTSEQPKRAGDYKVRALSNRTFGEVSYGKEYAFTILPKAISVEVSNSELQYGSDPEFTAELCYDDTLICPSFVYGDKSEEKTTVSAVEEEIVILDGEGNDVTASYEISTPSKEITFVDRKITITVKDKEKVYDGTPLSSTDYEITEGSLAFNDELIISEWSASQTAVGEAENAPTLDKILSGGEVVTDRYDITWEYGKLTVTARELKVNSLAPLSPWVYDGDDHYYLEYEIADGTLAEGESAEIVGHTSVKSVGKKENELTLKITRDGEEVTSNYDIDYSDKATLEVIKREVTVRAGDDSKVYDGTPLVCDSLSNKHTITAGSLVEGEELSFSASSLVEAGSADNIIDEESVTVKSGEDEVTENYDFTFEKGTLRVDKREITVLSGSGEWTYDTEKHYADTFTVTSETKVADNQTLSLLTTTQIVSVQYAFDEDTGKDEVTTAPNIQTYQIKEGERVVTQNYIITDDKGTLLIKPKPVTITTVSRTKTYDGFILYDGSTDYESVLYSGHVLNVIESTGIHNAGEKENEIIDYTITTSGNEIITGNYAVTFNPGTLKIEPRPIIVYPVSVSKVYDDTPLTPEKMVGVDKNFDFDDGVNALIDGHDIDLDDIEILGSITNAGEAYSTITDGTVHIIDKNDNDASVTGNYEITLNKGTLTVSKRPLKIQYKGYSWVYDGEEHTFDGYDIVVEGDFLAPVENHELVTSDHPSILKAGKTLNALTVAVEKQGESVNDNYEISYSYTENADEHYLIVTKRAITVESGSGERVYDGVGFTVSEKTITEGSLAGEGENADSLFVSYQSFPTDPVYDNEGKLSSYSNIFSVNITHPTAGDVTDSYEITRVFGKLTIKPAPLTVTPVAVEITYDGKTHVFDEVIYKVLKNGNYENTLFSNHTLSVEMAKESAFKNAGEYQDENIIASVKITGVEGIEREDKTHCYEITLNKGSVTILKSAITITTATVSIEYDGLLHTTKGAVDDEGNPIAEGEVTGGKLGTNDDGATHSLRIYKRYETPEANAGDYTYEEVNPDNKSVFLILDGETDESENYEITVVHGTITIFPRRISATPLDKTKIYDGTEMVFVAGWEDYENNDAVEVYRTVDESFDLVDGHKFVALNVTGKITDVGEVVTVIEEYRIEDENGKTVTENYAVTPNKGKLIVTPRYITITVYGKEKVFDGTALYNYEEGEGYAIAKTPQAVVDTINSDHEALSDGDNWYAVGQVFRVESYSSLIFPVVDASGEEIGILNELVYAFKWSIDETTVYAGNYYVTVEYDEQTGGMLNVLYRRITVKTESESWIYDGNEHTNIYNEYYSTDTENPYVPVIPINHEITITNIGKITNVGKVKNDYNIVITMDGEEKIIDIDNIERLVAGGYRITNEFGILTVTKRAITIETGSTTDYKFTGEILKNESFTVTYIDNESNEVTVTQDAPTVSLTREHIFKIIGKTQIVFPTEDEIENKLEFEVEVDGSTTHNEFDVEQRFIANFDITYNFGALKVLKRDITVTVKEGSTTEWVFDGLTHYGKYTVESDLYEKHTLTLTPAEIIFAGEKHNRPILKLTVTETEDEYAVYEPYTSTTRPLFEGYNITLPGDENKLIVKEKDITVTIHGKEILFDGLVHTYAENGTGFEFGEGFVTDAPVIEVKDALEVLFPRDSALNYMVFSISESINGELTEVTSSYNIAVEYGENDGKVTVAPRKFTITTANGSKVYDGKPFSEADFGGEPYYAVSYENELADGHTLSVALGVIGPAPGEYVNEVIVSVANADGEDMTDGYEFSVQSGTIVIEKRAITIETASNSWPYDGIPHSEPSYQIIEGELAEGQTSEIALEGVTEITEIGSALNELDIRIMDGENDVTECYEITFVNGVLKITPPDEEDEEEEDPSDPTQEPVDLLKVTSSVTTSLYLRWQSYGNYNGSLTFENAPVYSGRIPDSNESAWYMTSDTLEKAGVGLSSLSVEYLTDEDGNPLRQWKVLPYFIKEGSDTVKENDAANKSPIKGNYTYEYSYYANDPLYSSVSAVSRDYESAYREFVYENYLSVPTTTEQYFESNILPSLLTGEDKKTVIKNIAAFVRDNSKYNLKYDKALDKQVDVVVAFLSDRDGSKYDGAICQHYAASTTMLLRYAGIPARYTVGFYDEVTAGEEKIIDSMRGHAWVEAYLDGIGWVKVESTSGNVVEDNDEDAQSIKVKPSIFEYSYEEMDSLGDAFYDEFTVTEEDGAIIDAEEGDNGFAMLIEQGYKYTATLKFGELQEVTPDGKQIPFGVGAIGAVTVTGFSLYEPDDDGKSAPVLIYDGQAFTGDTEKYGFTFEEGEVRIIQDSIVVTFKKTEISYNGQPQSYPQAIINLFGKSYFYSVTSEGHEDYTVDINLNGVTQTVVGMVDADAYRSAGYTILNGEGEEVTSNYYLEIEGSLLTVTACDITVSSEAITAEYTEDEETGEPIPVSVTPDKFDITQGSLCSGHTIAYFFDNRQISDETPLEITLSKGSSVDISQYIKIGIYDEDGNAVTANYNLIFVAGEIKVV